MVEMEERELLLASLKGYLVGLAESGVDGLAFEARPAAQNAQPPAASFSQPRPGGACRVEGDPKARLLFVMSGPGFESAAGGLLEKIIGAMGFDRGKVCLVSFESGASNLRAAIVEQVALAAPEIVVTLGAEATTLLLQSDEPLERVRGRFHGVAGTTVMPSYHPADLLADEALKRDVWNDMKKVMGRLGNPG